MLISRIPKISFGKNETIFDGDGNPRKALHFLKAIDAQSSNKGASIYINPLFSIQSTDLMSERLNFIYQSNDNYRIWKDSGAGDMTIYFSRQNNASILCPNNIRPISRDISDEIKGLEGRIL